MLSDHERKALHELESHLASDDPEFPRSFDARAQRLQRAPLGMAATVAIVATALLGALMLAAGSPGGALVFAVVTGVIWLVRPERP